MTYMYISITDAGWVVWRLLELAKAHSSQLGLTPGSRSGSSTIGVSLSESHTYVRDEWQRYT